MYAMNEDFENGLSCDPERSHKSPIKMLVTYVRSTPNGTEEGDFYALDLGGTNFRVLLVEIHDKKIAMSHEQYAMDDSLMKGTGSKLFGYIAECLANFANHHKVDTLCSVGFTFSFPIDQKSLTSGNLIKWTKGYSADGVEGKDIVKLLHDEVDKRDVSLESCYSKSGCPNYSPRAKHSLPYTGLEIRKCMVLEIFKLGFGVQISAIKKKCIFWQKCLSIWAP